MINCDRIDVFEGIEVNKTSELKESDIWYHRYLSFNRMYDLVMMSINFSYIVSLKLKVLIIAVLLV